jgi:hypothetical protein
VTKDPNEVWVDPDAEDPNPDEKEFEAQIRETDAENTLADLVSPTNGGTILGSSRGTGAEPTPIQKEPEPKALSLEMNSAGEAQYWFMHYPVPADGKPDTTVDGKPYVRGQALCSSASDTVALKRLGFVGFSNFENPVGKRNFAGNLKGDSVSFAVIETCWPITVRTDDLPLSVPQIAAARYENARPVFSKVHMKAPVDDKP